jgi:hypothetical protein
MSSENDTVVTLHKNPVNLKFCRFYTGDSEFHVAALFVQGGDDSLHLGRFQFFILPPQKLKPETRLPDPEMSFLAEPH